MLCVFVDAGAGSDGGGCGGGAAESNTLLDILLEARETNAQLDEKQIHDEMLNVIVTVSEWLAWGN